MKHKNIAVLMTALDSDAQAEILKGIEKYGKSHGCNIAVFLWFTGAFEKEKHNMGEVNIAFLPDLKLFDGVIILSNVFHMDNNRKRIEDMLAGLSCPIVCIGCKLKDYYYIETDNYNAMRELVEHYVTDHGMKRIHFVKGVEGNEDAEARFKAYTDVLEEHGIPVVPERISQGDFYVTGAELAAKEILNSSLPFPEAIVCANDTMAITICDILMEKGYRVPEDVVISGYDYSPEGQYHFPRMTTVRSRFADMGSEACRVVLEVLEDGNKACGREKRTVLTDDVILSESCGCHKDYDNGENRLSFMHLNADMAQRKLIHQMLMLEKNIMEGDDFSDWQNAVKIFVEQVAPKEFYFCANDKFVENIFEMGGLEQEEMTPEERLAYSPYMDVIIAYQNGVFKKKASFASQLAFDDLFQDTEGGKLYIFSPLHYLERNFGYVIFVDSSFPFANPLYISWLITMGDSIENIRKQSLLKIATKRLDEMYIRDSLTGAYNRFGMERHFADVKQKCLMYGVPMQVSFVDIDGLKSINDEYGHEEGDRIIHAAASGLKRQAGKYYVVRYGGDEFVVIGTAQRIEEVEDYWKRVEREVELYNETLKRNASLSMSYGYALFEIETDTKLDDLISVADKKMYIEKNRKKNKDKNSGK